MAPYFLELENQGYGNYLEFAQNPIDIRRDDLPFWVEQLLPYISDKVGSVSGRSRTLSEHGLEALCRIGSGRRDKVNGDALSWLSDLRRARSAIDEAGSAVAHTSSSTQCQLMSEVRKSTAVLYSGATLAASHQAVCGAFPQMQMPAPFLFPVGVTVHVEDKIHLSLLTADGVDGVIQMHFQPPPDLRNPVTWATSWCRRSCSPGGSAGQPSAGARRF